MQLLVAIPVRNEENIIVRNVTTLKLFLDDHFKDCQIVIVDNSSTDRTVQIATELSKRHGNVRLIQIQERGKGKALKTAFKKFDSDVYAYIDVDLPIDLSNFATILNEVRDGNADICIGSKLLPESQTSRPWIRSILSRLFQAMLVLMFGISISDTQGGFKAMSKSVVRNVMNETKDDKFFWDTELLILSSRRGYRIKEVPVRCVDKRFSPKIFFEAVPDMFFSTIELWIKLILQGDRIVKPDYGYKAYHSKNPIQRYWQRRKVSETLKLADPNSRVLDVGCGSAIVSERLASEKRCRVFLTDVDTPTLEYSKSRTKLPAVVAEATVLPFRDESFDCVVTLEVIEHIDKPADYLVEIKRVMREGGKLILSTPNYDSLFPLVEFVWDAFGKAKGYMKEEHKTKFSPMLLQKLLKRSGLSIGRMKTILCNNLLTCLCSKGSRFENPQ